MTFDDFYRSLTGFEPFPYQERMVEDDLSGFLAVPTGLGKTAAIVLGWRYRRLVVPERTPRRLVYCLPMRSLVDQVAANCRDWLAAERELWPERVLPSVHVLMGGNTDESYLEHPERDSILIGTQDMLLSRALNRGYGMSRYSWPMSFGTLNNDVLWVFDETQLQGVALETSAQLHAFRNILGVANGAQTLWASATLDVRRLATVDHHSLLEDTKTISLNEDDLAHPVVQQRMGAIKTLHWAELPVLPSKTVFSQYVQDAHVPGTLTLVVLNRVQRSRELYEALEKQYAAQLKKSPEIQTPALALIHSRFRSADRAEMEKVLLGDGDRIVVATQAVEAGMDVSAQTMLTELAPWSSLVQRFGRCNRRGEYPTASIQILRLDTSKDAQCLPYSAPELVSAEQAIDGLLSTREVSGLEELLEEALWQDGQTDDESARDNVEPPLRAGFAGIDALAEVTVQEERVVRPVLRRRDLLELFDTTSDLLGLDLDVSRYIRDGDDTDIQVFWRDFDGVPAADIPQPERVELCRVGISDARKLIGTLEKRFQAARKSQHADAARWRAYVWDSVDRKWVNLGSRDVRPGQTALLSSSVGGYSPTVGFTGDISTEKKSADRVPSLMEAGPSVPSLEDERETRTGVWVELGSHLEHVRDECTEILSAVGATSRERTALRIAAVWHDVGKAHPVFQAMLCGDDEERHRQLWAKSDSFARRSTRPYFRHELASAFAWHAYGEEHPDRDLISWLIACHHGKIRVSLRSVPGEQEAPNGRVFARGVWDGDTLPALNVPDFGEVGPFDLRMSPVAMGAGSWTELALGLRDSDEWGPFRLAWLETVLRAADWRASAKEARR